MEWNFDPVLIDFGFFKIHYYGVIFAAGIFVGYLMWRWQMLRRGYTHDHVEDFVLWAFLAVIVGARLGHCLFYQPGYFLWNPHKMLFFWEGGLASHGATIALMLTLYFYHRWQRVDLLELAGKHKQTLNQMAQYSSEHGPTTLVKNLQRDIEKKQVTLQPPVVVSSQGQEHWTLLDSQQRRYFVSRDAETKTLRLQTRIPLLEVLDCFSFSAAVGATAVRIGNFFNSEIVGRVTDVPWAIKFPRYTYQISQKLGMRIEPQPRHPSQLYEVALGLSVLLALYLVDRHYGNKRPQGLLAAVFLSCYFCGRFVVEYFKEYQTLSPTFPLTMGQILSIPFAGLGIGLLIWSIRHWRQQQSDSEG